jgi:LAO/AO transport system kinase
VSGAREGPEALVAGVLAGEARALARAISLVESSDAAAGELVAELYPHTGRAHTIGVTGPPGAGKSTLVSALTAHVRARAQSVGVISVDPSSPFTEGALLGDRIRLVDHFLDSGVFIRSMSARGHGGGLAEATLQAVLILDAAGKDVVFVETVGAGQSDVGVLSVADTVVLVLLPGSGDSVQALKAGIMEIPDVIAIAKSDHPAAKSLLQDVRRTLALGPPGEPQPAIVLTEAPTDGGVGELLARIDEHRTQLEADGTLAARRRRSVASEVVAIAAARARRRIEAAIAADPDIRLLLDGVAARTIDPLTAAKQILDRMFTLGDENGSHPH